MDVGGSKMSLEDLIAKAKKLGIEFESDSITEDELNAMIEVAEAQKKVDDNKKKTSTEKDADYLQAELDKAITKRDDIKKERRKLITKNKELEAKIAGLPDSDEIKSLKEELEALKDFKSEIDKKKEEDELKKLDEVERLKISHRKTVEEKEAELQAEKDSLAKIKEEEEAEKSDLQNQIKELRTARLEAEIVKVAATKSAWNPDQVARLVRDDFTYDDDLQRYIHTVRDAKGKLIADKEVDEYVSEYLEKEENENLIRSDVNNTTLHADRDKLDQSTGSKKTTTKKESKSYDPNDPEIKEAAEMENMEPDRYIEKVLKPMESALSKRSGGNNETE